jgi:hypothetical protein
MTQIKGGCHGLVIWSPRHISQYHVSHTCTTTPSTRTRVSVTHTPTPAPVAGKTPTTGDVLARLWLLKPSGQAVYGSSSLALAWLGLSHSLEHKNKNRFGINLILCCSAPTESEGWGCVVVSWDVLAPVWVRE